MGCLICNTHCGLSGTSEECPLYEWPPLSVRSAVLRVRFKRRPPGFRCVSGSGGHLPLSIYKRRFWFGCAVWLTDGLKEYKLLLDRQRKCSVVPTFQPLLYDSQQLPLFLALCG